MTATDASTTPAYAPVHGTVLGRPIQVMVPDDAVRAAVTRVLSGFAAPDLHAGGDTANGATYTLDRTEEGFWSVSGPLAGFNTNGGLTDGLLALEYQIVTDALARHTGLFHLHGAALATPDGGAGVLVVGESGSGKTTLVLALLRRGFVPYSDDVALMEPDTLALRPFPRAFHVRQPSLSLLARLGMAAAAFADAPPGFYLPPRWAVAPVPVRVVLFPALRPDAPPALAPLAPAESAALLLAQSATLAVPGAVRLALGTVARLTTHARCYRLYSGDLVATLDRVTEAVAASESERTP